MQIHYNGGNGLKCDFYTAEGKISTSVLQYKTSPQSGLTIIDDRAFFNFKLYMLIIMYNAFNINKVINSLWHFHNSCGCQPCS